MSEMRIPSVSQNDVRFFSDWRHYETAGRSSSLSQKLVDAGFYFYSWTSSNSTVKGGGPETKQTTIAPSEYECFRLAESEPEKLLSFIERDILEPYSLTFAAEALGRTSVPGLERALLKLSRDERALVREGAVYGLAVASFESAVERLTQMATSDPSPGVRDAARELIAS